MWPSLCPDLCWVALLKAPSMILKRSNSKCRVQLEFPQVPFQKVKMIRLGKLSRIPKNYRSYRSQTIRLRHVSLIITLKKTMKIAHTTWSWTAPRFQSRRIQTKRMTNQIYRDFLNRWKCQHLLKKDQSLHTVIQRTQETWAIRWWINSCAKARIHRKNSPQLCQGQGQALISQPILHHYLMEFMEWVLQALNHAFQSQAARRTSCLVQTSLQRNKLTIRGLIHNLSTSEIRKNQTLPSKQQE